MCIPAHSEILLVQTSDENSCLLIIQYFPFGFDCHVLKTYYDASSEPQTAHYLYNRLFTDCLIQITKQMTHFYLLRASHNFWVLN